jgi:hypothetical protein
MTSNQEKGSRIQTVLDGVRVEIRLTQHARQRMIERGVKLKEVLEALRNPCEHAYDKSKDVALLLGCNKVALAYVQRATYIEVVTVMREIEYYHLTRRIGRRRYKII